MPLKGIIILFDDPQAIFERMQLRDGKSLDINIIEQLQNKELELGKLVSEILKVPLITITSSESFKAINWIKTLRGM